MSSFYPLLRAAGIVVVAGITLAVMVTPAGASTAGEVSHQGGEAGGNVGGLISLINPQGSDSMVEIDDVLSDVTVIDLGDR